MIEKRPNEANGNRPQTFCLQRINLQYIRPSLCKTNPIPGGRGRDIEGLAMPEAGTQTSSAHSGSGSPDRRGMGRANLETEHACPIGAASGEWQMEDDGGRARTARAEGRWRMTSPRWSRMAAMQPRAATRCQSKAWVGSRDTTRIVSLRIRQTTRLESCPSAPVIASNQQGESPCRSVLALRNRR